MDNQYKSERRSEGTNPSHHDHVQRRILLPAVCAMMFTGQWPSFGAEVLQRAPSSQILPDSDASELNGPGSGHKVMVTKVQDQSTGERSKQSPRVHGGNE